MEGFKALVPCEYVFENLPFSKKNILHISEPWGDEGKDDAGYVFGKRSHLPSTSQ